MRTLDDMRADRRALVGESGGKRAYVSAIIRRPEAVAVVEYRISRVLRQNRIGSLLAVALHVCARVWSSVDIHPEATIGGGLLIDHGPGVVIGPGSVLGRNCRLYQGVTVGQNHGVEPTLGNGVILSPGAKVLGGINIGDGALIGANAVVLSDVPAGGVSVGIPARVLPSAS